MLSKWIKIRSIDTIEDNALLFFSFYFFIQNRSIEKIINQTEHSEQIINWIF